MGTNKNVIVRMQVQGQPRVCLQTEKIQETNANVRFKAIAITTAKHAETQPSAMSVANGKANASVSEHATANGQGQRCEYVGCESTTLRIKVRTK